jgi:hypothetical protein
MVGSRRVAVEGFLLVVALLEQVGVRRIGNIE